MPAKNVIGYKVPSLRGAQFTLSLGESEIAYGRSKASPDSGTARADKSARTKSPRLWSVEQFQDRAEFVSEHNANLQIRERVYIKKARQGFDGKLNARIVRFSRTITIDFFYLIRFSRAFKRASRALFWAFNCLFSALKVFMSF